MKIGIATAKIDLSQEINRFKRYEVWLWNITFLDASTTSFSNLLVELPSSKKAAKKKKKEIKDAFKELGIKSGSTVIVLFNRESDDIIAITSPGKKLWVDVEGNYKLKEIGFHSESLRVFLDQPKFYPLQNSLSRVLSKGFFIIYVKLKRGYKTSFQF